MKRLQRSREDEREDEREEERGEGDEERQTREMRDEMILLNNVSNQKIRQMN